VVTSAPILIYRGSNSADCLHLGLRPLEKVLKTILM
jgi:hypothetical protein